MYELTRSLLCDRPTLYHFSRAPSSHWIHSTTRMLTDQKLKAVFEQRGLNTSDVEVRNWINERDTSGTGAVDFEDFSRAFVFSL